MDPNATLARTGSWRRPFYAPCADENTRHEPAPTWGGGKPLPVIGVTTVHCFQIGHTYGAHLATDHCLLTDDDGRCVSAVPAVSA